MKRILSFMLALIMMLSITAYGTEAPPKASTLTVKFLDVGQADAALLECDGHYMMIDGGNKADSSLIYSVLKDRNVKHFDIIVATHPHEDHIGGLAGALNYATSDITLTPVTSYDSEAFRDFKRYADINGGKIVVPKVGESYSLGSAAVKILAVNSAADDNNRSIVLKVTHGENSFLFTGDAERETEQVLLNSKANLSAAILKVAHHGSETSTTYPFLREVMPLGAVISVGKDNTYGHPDENTLSRLKDAGSLIFRTDLNGDITFISDGKEIAVATEKDETAQSSTAAPTAPAAAQTTVQPPVQQQAAEKQSVDYIANKNTKKFHYPGCSSVRQMKESNKLKFSGSRDELIARGYDPCKRCYP